MNKELDNILMYKDGRPSNNIYFIIKETKDYFITRKVDTLDDEETDIIALPKELVKEKMYTIKSFLENSIYVGKSGYYKGLDELTREIVESFILVYRDE